MTLYRPRGETVEAWQVGSGEPEPEWVSAIRTKQGDLYPAHADDWIIRDREGVIDMLQNWQFRERGYEPVDGDAGASGVRVAGDGETAAGGGLDNVHSASWRPIKTAPKDGTEVILAIPSFGKGPTIVVVGWWSEGGWRDESDCFPFHPPTHSSFRPPTHWMPLPEPPHPDMKEKTT